MENINYSEITDMKATLLNAIYPIGAIYMTTSSVNPADLFGGTWKPFAQGRTIVGTGTSDRQFGAETTGGHSAHTLSIDELAPHTHDQESHNHTGKTKNFGYWFSLFAQHEIKPDSNFPALYKNACKNNVTLTQTDVVNNTEAIGKGNNWGYRKTQVKWSHKPEIEGATAVNQKTGSGQPHNNLQPYIVTYIWCRIA